MKQYAIFSVGRKMKDITQIRSFKQHVLREIDTPNADKSLTSKNEIMIGSPDIVEDFKRYTTEVKLRKNNVLARDMILATSHEYMMNLSEEDKNRWLYFNWEFLNSNFSKNCLFAIIHRDETQPLHIHALIVPRFEHKGNIILSNSRYFDGKQKLCEWQDKYYDHIAPHFPGLSRGIKYSRADHMDIRKVYSIITGATNVKFASIEEAEKAFDILSIKLEATEKKLEGFTRQLARKNIEIEELKKQIITPTSEFTKSLNINQILQ